MPNDFSPYESNSEYRCFYFIHVRIGTLLLGIWQTLAQISAMMLVLALIVNPHIFPTTERRLQWESILSIMTLGQNDAFITDRKAPMSYRHSTKDKKMSNDLNENIDYSTQQDLDNLTDLYDADDSSVIQVKHRSEKRFKEKNSEKLLLQQKTPSGLHNVVDNSGSKMPIPIKKSLPERHHSRLSDRLVSFAVIFFSMGFTILLFMGALQGRPSYLMPYFCLQVFDLVIACITVVGYFSYMPDMKHWIKSQEVLPYKKELLKLNEVALSLLLMTVGAAVIALKFYLLHMVWTCYKFLVRRYNGVELESGFCLYRPPNLRLLLAYHLWHGNHPRAPGDRSTAAQFISPPQPIPVPISCCGLFAHELREDNYRAGLRATLLDNADDDSGTQPLLSCQSHADAEGQTILPKYDDLLLTPANANMPPPYYK